MIGVTASSLYCAHWAYTQWQEERDHSGFLYDCTHAQRPAECENVWLSQYAVHSEP